MATDRIDTAEQLAAAEAAVRDLTEQVDQQRTRAEAAEAELREALRAIDDLTKALDRERRSNEAQCREADRE